MEPEIIQTNKFMLENSGAQAKKTEHPFWVSFSVAWSIGALSFALLFLAFSATSGGSFLLIITFFGLFLILAIPAFISSFFAGKSYSVKRNKYGLSPRLLVRIIPIQVFVYALALYFVVYLPIFAISGAAIIASLLFFVRRSSFPKS